MNVAVFISVALHLFQHTACTPSGGDSLNKLWSDLQEHDVQDNRQSRHIPLTSLLESLDPDPDVIKSDSDSSEKPFKRLDADVTTSDSFYADEQSRRKHYDKNVILSNTNALQSRGKNLLPFFQTNLYSQFRNQKLFNPSLPKNNIHNGFKSNAYHVYPPSIGLDPNYRMNPFQLMQPAVKKSNNEIGKNVNKFGTTKHLRDIFIGRCYEYQFQQKIAEEKQHDCIVLWKLFIQAFVNKGPCDVTLGDYKPFLSRLKEEIPINQGLLWSGTREIAHKYSDFAFKKRFTTLEDTMAGYLTNGLTWCGKAQEPGINFDACPWKCSIQEPYWAMANKQFAQGLRGIVHIILNGTRQHLEDRRIYPSYMKDRYYLGPYIIPELKADRISKVFVIVVHTLHLKPLESCGERTVQLLVNDIKAKGIPVECQNDPDVLKDILCVDDPRSLECISLQRRNAIAMESSQTIVR